MGDGKCPDIYECRLGVNQTMRENFRLKMVCARYRKALKKIKNNINRKNDAISSELIAEIALSEEEKKL